MEEVKKNRMVDLIKSFDTTNEVYVEKDVSESEEKDKKLNEEFSTLKKLISKDTNADFKEAWQGNYAYANTDYKLGKGKTVNSIVDDIYHEPLAPTRRTHTPLQAEEALEVAVKRTIKSGAPVNNMSFYDEINWNLMNLGFASKSPIDIKNAIGEIIEK